MNSIKRIIVGLCLFSAPMVSAYEINQTEKAAVTSNDLNTVRSLSKSTTTIADHAGEAIVFISISKIVKGVPFGQVNPFEFFFGPGPGQQGQQGRQAPREEKKQSGLGSGFFIDVEKGYVLTNNHVVEGADEINLRLANGSTYEAKVVGRDKNTDVAVVQVQDSKFKRKGVSALKIAKSKNLKPGEFVLALGAPFGLEASLSFGIVSALGRGSLSITELGDFIQTDAAINPGNSGGPLLNMEGNVVGINTAIYSRSGGYNGIGFAIPSDLVVKVANQLISKGKIERGYLGVGLNQGLDPELAEDMGVPSGTSGALVRTVEPDGPADKSGIEAGDIIVSVDGKLTKSDVALRNRIGLNPPGAQIKLELYRDGDKKTVKVKLAKFPSRVAQGMDRGDDGAAQDRAFGLAVETLNSKLRKEFGIKQKSGVVVTSVARGSVADRMGIEVGDAVVKLNNKAVSSAKQFYSVVKGKKRVYVRLVRDGRLLFFPLKK
ncbi:Do family serine endopeptidase [Oligoflexaceae bacterium]|nr:Do family serine endopeptidase [Oligoflexaceae bacterium]